MDNKRKQLYNNLIGTGRVSDVEIGSLDEFQNAIKDERTARQFHKNLLGAGFTNDEIGTEDEFYNSISSDFLNDNEPDPFDANVERAKRGEPIQRVSTQSMINAHPELGLSDSSYEYKPEVQQHILDNKPDIFKPKQSLMDAPLNTSAPEGSQEKFNERIGVAVKNLNDPTVQKSRTEAEFRGLNASVDEELKSIEDQITSRAKAIRNENWRPGMPSTRDDSGLASLRGQRSYLEGAKELLEESEKIINASKDEKDGTFIGGILRGTRDKVFDVDTWTMGLSDLVGGLRLKNVLEKVEKDEQLSSAEEKLLDAAVTNMAVNAYFASDLGKGYKAGQVTGESIPFMLEMAINPISASGNKLAKSLLKAGMKRFGSSINNNVAKATTRLATDALAATGMAATTGMPGVLGETVDRLNKNYNYGIDANGNLYAQKTGDVSFGEALGRSFTTRALENQSEMIFRAFDGAGELLKGVNVSLPGGVNTFFDYIKNSKVGELWRGIKNSPLRKELAEATKVGGIGEEYLEEVYNNFANVALGEMSMEEALNLDNNIDTFLGLAPTQVMFSMLGLGNMAALRYKTRRDIEDLRATMNESQRQALDGLLAMGTTATNQDVREFIRNTMANQFLSIDEKRNAVKAAYDVARQKAMADVQEAEVEDKIAEENADIDAKTDPQSGNYGEVTLLGVDESGEPTANPANVFGAKVVDGELYLLVLPEGETEKKWVRPHEYDAESHQIMPGAEVKAYNEQMIRDNAAKQAEQEAKYAPDVLNAQMQQGIPFEDATAVYIPFQVTPEGNAWQVEVYNKDENGNQSKKPTRTDVITNDQFRDILQAQYEANEAAQQQPVQEIAPTTEEEVTNTPVATEEVTPTEEVQPEVVEEVQQPQQQAPVIPTKEDGSIDFVSYGKDNTFKTLGEKYGEKMPNKVAVTAKALAEDLVKAQEKLSKAEEAYDNAPIGREQKAEQARDKAKAELESIQREADFWSSLDNEIKEAQAKRDALLNPKADVDMSEEPMSAEEFIAQQLANGNIALESASYKKETGYGEKERQKFIKMFRKAENGGMTIEGAGDLLMQMDRENGTNFFDQTDANAGRDALINFLGSVSSWGDITGYIRNNREAQASKETEGLRNEIEDAIEANYHMTPEEYATLQEMEATENPFEGVDIEEKDAIFAEAALEYEEYLKSLENGQGTTEEVIEGNGDVLSEEQFDNSGGTEQRQGEGLDVSEGTVQSDDAAQEESAEVEEGNTPFRQTESILEQAERIANEEARRNPLRQRAKEWEQKLGVKVNIIENFDDVTNKDAKRAIRNGQRVTGWYEESTGEVCLYMPYLESAQEIDATYIHEVVAHKGLRGLLGDKFDEFLDDVWSAMSEADKLIYLTYPGVNGNKKAAADEYIAHLAENIDVTESAWGKLAELIKKFLKAIGLEPKMTNADIANAIKRSYQRLAEGGIAENAMEEDENRKEKTLFRTLKDKKELVAVHNISEDNLRKVLEVGGLIMPSIAITKYDMGHEGYGEISLLFDKETINPSDRRNKVYGGDAWTPRFPKITPKINEKVSSNVKKKIYELIEDRRLRENYNLSSELHFDQIENAISNNGVEGYYNKEWMKLAYLLDSGKKVKVPMKMKDYGDMSETIIAMAKDRGLKVSDIQQGGFDFYNENKDFVEAVKNIVDERKLSSLPEDKRAIARKLFGEKEMRFVYFDTLISAATRMEYDLEHGGLQQILDRTALRETIEKKVKTNNADYNKWVDNLFDGIVEKYGIRNDRDWYTPSGNLRPWEQLYNNVTPANILRYMLAQSSQGGSGGLFDSNIMGAAAETYGSIEEIREKGKKRLRRLEEGEYDEWSNSITERVSNITYEFLSPSQKEEFGSSIDAMIAITNAVAKDKTANGIYKEMKSEYPRFTMDNAKELEAIVEEIQEQAIGYFEAKPQRIVSLSEVRKAVVPSNVSEDILEGLQNNGIEIATYKKGNEASRKRVIKKESEGIRFRTLPSMKLRKLEEGEKCNVERVFTQQKMFNFSSGEKIESYEDVAYIFKSLEDEAIENTFVALIKDGKPTIVHLGMGTANQSTLDQQAVIVAIDRIKPDEVYMVHNHPSGNLKASRQDVVLLDSMKKAYGSIVKDGIIINLRSGRYSVFNEEGSYAESNVSIPSKEIPVKTYSFSKRVFDKDFDIQELINVRSADDANYYAEKHGLVAALTSSQRLGDRDKISLLVIDQSGKIVGNVFLNHTDVTPSNMTAISKDIAYYTSAMSGQFAIIFGRMNIKEAGHLNMVVQRVSAGSVKMFDAISVNKDGGYVSAANEGVMEEAVDYANNYTRFRIANKNQEIFVSNAQKAVEGIKQEKATPQQWLAMIEKNGGLKAGEDKWLGLSDWLKVSDTKTITKSEILDFINQNKIQIEEVKYGDWGNLDKRINSIRRDYTTEGLTNKQEIALVVPTIEPWNEDDEVHFGDAGEGRAVAWIRFGETTAPKADLENAAKEADDALTAYQNELAEKYLGDEGSGDPTEYLDMMSEDEGKHMRELSGKMFDTRETANANQERVLVIDEIQSKRHQEGREKGYKDGFKSQLDAAESEWLKCDKAIMDKAREVAESLGMKKMDVYKDITAAALYRGRQKEFNDKRLEEIYGQVLSDEFHNLSENKFAAGKVIDGIKVKLYDSIPSAPFEKNWHELAMKRMLRYAAENGFDKVAWTTGAQQAERYYMSKSIDSILCEDETISEFADGTPIAKAFVLTTSGGMDIRINADKDGMIRGGEYAGHNISDVVGKELAGKMMQPGNFTISGEGLHIGGEGMKGFYDKMLPSFVNKYVKKWGTKVQDIELPELEEAGHIMHSVDVTDAMKESVMEGQTMFRVNGRRMNKIMFGVNRFTNKYNSSPVHILSDNTTDDEVRAWIGVDGIDARDLINWMDDEKSSAMHSALTGEIIIFADRMHPKKIEKTLFHENLHNALKYGNHKDLIAKFYESAIADEKFNKWKKLSDKYEDVERKEEFFVYVVSNKMTEGNLEEVFAHISQEAQKELLEILNKKGYNYEQERNRRTSQTGDESWGLRMRNSDVQQMAERETKREGSQKESGRRSKEQAERLKKLFDDVADMGLRGVLGNTNYDLAMLDIFYALPEKERTDVAVRAVKIGGDVAVAVDEFLNNVEEPTLLEKVIASITNALRKVGINVELTENDVKYLLWRSRKPLNINSIFDIAEDIDMRRKLKVGKFDNDPTDGGDTPGGGTRFRVAKEQIDIADERTKIIKKYDKELESKMFNFQEAFQDRMLSLKVLMDLIENATGKKAKSFEDAYTAENQLGSINRPAQLKWLDEFYKPLLEELNKLSKKYGQKGIERYIYCKSGLERNEVLRQRDADETYEAAKAELDEKLAKNQIDQAQYQILIQQADDERKKTLATDTDYSGIRGLLMNTRADDLYDQYVRGVITEAKYKQEIADLKKNEEKVIKDWKQFAENQVANIEKKAEKAELDALWDKINAATNETLRIDFESGMIDRDTYNAEKKMMKYYVPLRNWENTTAEEMYEYRHDMTQAVSSNQKRAKGRKSQADNPIATIALMAQNAIVRGNRNKMKQKLYSFVANRETSLASVRNVWYVRNANNQWEPQYADTSNAKTEAEIKQIMEQFELDMQKLEAQGDAFKGKLKQGMGYRANRKQKDEHVVTVMINGKEYGIYINGNPRAAQAVNGLTNAEGIDDAGKWIDNLKRYYGAGLTSWNPDFIIPNLVRDSIHATTMTFLDKGAMSAAKYIWNTPKVFSQVFKEVSGVGVNDPKLHQYFEEFVANGGETGYTAIHTLEDYKKEYDKLMNEAKGIKSSMKNGLKEGISKLSSILEASNRIAEDVNRFNAYVTSREEGYDIVKSIDAAKNITVNFNRKGALASNTTAFGKVASLMSRWILFFNPGVQGIYQLVTKSKLNPKRAKAIGATILASGFFMPMINELLVAAAGGDDEDDYWNQTDFKRRNNWMLFTGDGYVTIPLPPVLRELYGIGDIMYGIMTGHINPSKAIYDTLKQIQSAVGFVNLLPEVSHEPDMITYVKGFAPDVAAPILDIVTNTNFMGSPIAKWTDYNEFDPEYMRVYKGVSPVWKELSMLLNEVGGEEGLRSNVWGNFINPAMMEHLITSYTGGIGKTINNIIGMALDDKENIDLFRKSPILPRFYTPNDEKTVQPAINRKYYDFDYEYNRYSKALKKYEKAIESGEHPEWQKHIDEMEKDRIIEFINYFKAESKVLKKLTDKLKVDSQNKELESDVYDKKAEIATNSFRILRGN